MDLAVPTPTSPAAAEACHRLHDALPDTAHDEPRRTTNPGSTFTAAWGDPAITLTCGVDQPAALAPTSQLFTVDGVTWFPQELTSGYRFTTVDRVANVQVDVPDTYAPEADVLTELARPVRTSVRRA